MLLCRPDSDRAASGNVQAKSHDGLVNAANLLNGKPPVTESLTIQQYEVGEHAIQHAIGNPRNDRFVFPIATAFKEKVAIGIKQVSFARRDLHPSVAAARTDQPKQRQELRPRAVALVHGVVIAARVGTEPFVKPSHRVVVGVHRIGRKKCTILGIQHKDKTQQGRQKTVINMIGISREDLAEQFSFGLIIRRLEATQHLVKGLENLFG